MNKPAIDLFIRKRTERLLDILSPLPHHKEVTSIRRMYDNHPIVCKEWVSDSDMSHSHTIALNQLQQLVKEDYKVSSIRASKQEGLIIEIHDIQTTQVLERSKKK